MKQAPIQLDVSVILVGLNARDYIRQCVDSLAAATWRDCAWEVIYVDNGSRDDTLKMLADNYPSVRVIANPNNAGFCKAANQGAEIALGRHYCFLNDDTIVLNDAVALQVEYLDAHPDVGTVGGRLVYPDMTEQWSGRMFPSPLNGILGRRSFASRFFPNAAVLSDYLCKAQVAKNEPFPVDWVSAAAQTVPRDVFSQVGGFAEDYYYWHEAVFCDRITRLGKRVILLPAAKIIHFEGKGSGKRPHPVRRFHILDFHKGAFRCYCERYNLRRFSPVRWAIGAALGTRAALLLVGSWFMSFSEGSPLAKEGNHD